MLSVQSGDLKAAEPVLREAVSVAENNLGEEHPDTAAYESNLGLVLYLEGQYDRAVVLLHRARYIVEAKVPGSEEDGDVLSVLTLVETALGKFDLAEADGKQLVGIACVNHNSDNLEIALAKVALATVYLRERKFDEAAKILPEAIAVERRSADDPRMRDQRVLAYAVIGLGEARAAQRNWTEAESLYSEAIGIYEAKLGEGNPTIAPVLREYARILKHAGAPRKEVKRIEAKANAIAIKS
jgi:tetratricopeptide (TPR) repeat protein